MGTRNPYEVDRYAECSGKSTRGIRGAISNAAGMFGCLFTMGALFFGMLYVLWRASGH